MMISPTEPERLRVLGRVAWHPESFGADVMWRSRGRWIGIQRKEVTDLVASVSDGRLHQQLVQMQQLDVAVVLVEGEPCWTNDGEMLNGSGHSRGLSPRQWQSVMWTIGQRGVMVDRSKDLTATIAWIEGFQAWCAKERHTGLMKRPAPINPWGTLGNEDFQRHMVMGLPGVGTELADRIIRTLGMPFGWRVSEDELLTVEGLGPKKVARILGALGGM